MRNKQPFDACSDFYVNSRCYIVNFLMLLAESHSKYDHSFSPFSIVMKKNGITHKGEICDQKGSPGRVFFVDLR